MSFFHDLPFGKIKNILFVRYNANFIKSMLINVNSLRILNENNAKCLKLLAKINFLQAYFLTPFVRLEICSEACSSYTFPKILGKSKSSEMLLLNHKLTADEALKFKFVSEVFAPADLDTKIWPKIEKFAELSMESMMVCKKLNFQMDQDHLEKACENEMKELRRLKMKQELKNAENKQSKL